MQIKKSGEHYTMSMQKQLYTPKDNGLYLSRFEHDACGVGLVANMRGEASHRIIEQGITVLKRLMHRGASGADPDTGDGAGLLIALPDAFFRAVVDFSLPEPGRYGVAMMFGGVGAEPAIENVIKREGGRILGWRQVPICADSIGEVARASVPCIRQLFLTTDTDAPEDAEINLYVIRRCLEKSIPDLYICSMSSRTIVYKGLLQGGQLDSFYSDLSDIRMVSPLVLVHQRYSTNTFPTWALAQPFRYLAHNGEINTLRGNLNAQRARENLLKSSVLGARLNKLLPLINGAQSDSACLDNMLELLVAAGRPLEHALLMLIPQAWGENYHMGRDVRAFFEYHSALMEPWDGPAAIVATDGRRAVALLDRNGLRPLRYTECYDGLFVLASEAGVLDLPQEQVRRKGRLKPGGILVLDIPRHLILEDAEVKTALARSKPYRRWVEENRLSVRGLFSEITAAEPEADLIRKQVLFGYSREDVDIILSTMAGKGTEPIGSMGMEAAPAVLSDKPQLLFNYFKQSFAQVTNPPIDPIREELVMSLMTYIGNKGNILEESPEHAKLIKLRRPILTDDELMHLSTLNKNGYETAEICCGFSPAPDGTTLRLALKNIAQQAVEAVMQGKRLVVLTDRKLPDGYAAIPSLLATACVHKALVENNLRPEAGIIVSSGEVREVMHSALLLGYGATAINPWLALQSVTELSRADKVGCDAVTAAGNYVRAMDKGLLKIMSKLGISTLRSYRSAQAFEALGLSLDFINEFLPGTVTRIGGAGLNRIAADAAVRLVQSQSSARALSPGGVFKYHKKGESRLWTPQAIKLFREAVWENNEEKMTEFSALIDHQTPHPCTLRSLLDFREVPPVPLEEVENEGEILKHFVSGAMSLGSLSPEAHHAIAAAMNSIGARSNCGEGGEEPSRFGTLLNSATKQVASGRFGVTADYLCHADEIQIKMAQGAKPGEGGQLPAFKVDAFIAGVRHSIPQVSLISPPPHHDIYSIEDFAQLIYDLRQVNPRARISVKLASEMGVGTVCAGVAKANADSILISGYDGGTGASPLTSIRHTGLPWELGLAEAHQTLVINNLRNRVLLQTDGQLKTGRDVVIAALLGAEEFGFGTTLLVCLGCAMIRQCHNNTCPMGVATQDAEKRKRFIGKPEYIVNYLRFVAGQVRRILASLGLHSIQEACGRADLLCVKEDAARYGLDLSALLIPAHATGEKVRNVQDNNSFDARYLSRLPQGSGSPGSVQAYVFNTDRSVGTALSGRMCQSQAAAKLSPDHICLNLRGTAGQSFGAFLVQGITLRLVGEANDFVGKGLSGGCISIRVPAEAAFRAEDNVIAGNVVGYGATSGRIFINGRAGERFAVRNSGAILVAEGVGDHGCEYMTGGRVVVLGAVGVNFAAGMTGGIAYVYDEYGDFDLHCNTECVDLENVPPDSEAEHELLALIQNHHRETGSVLAERMIINWLHYRPRFVRVFPVEYRRALRLAKSADSLA